MNTSCSHRGMMGYQTPNIDRVAREGALFTDSYAQQSCTAGRASFIAPFKEFPPNQPSATPAPARPSRLWRPRAEAGDPQPESQLQP